MSTIIRPSLHSRVLLDDVEHTVISDYFVVSGATTDTVVLTRNTLDHIEVAYEAVTSAETYLQFLQRTAMVIEAGLGLSGVSRDAWDEMRQFIGIDRLALGRGASYAPSAVEGALPGGTVMTVGSPNHWSTYGEWEMRDGGWHRRYGRLSPGGYLVGRLVVHPDEQEYLLATATDEDAEKIEAARYYLWESGWAEKERRSWCGAYEVTMAGVGMNSTIFATMERPSIALEDLVVPS